MPDIPECIGPYRVLARIGEGGMGVVFKAQDERLRRIVALKVISGFRAEPSRRQRFWQEARAAAQVSHPNACRLYDIAEEGDSLVLVMEFLEGESLAQRLQRGPLPAREAAQIVLAVLSALEAFHKAGIVHRDLKPGNIMLSSQGIKLLDFGLAKHCAVPCSGEADATLVDVSIQGVFLGTPRYASPEQFLNQPVDTRSDLFSVGAIHFEMLTGQPPFPGGSFGEIAHSVLHLSPPALTGSPAISAISRIVNTALSREPRDRYPSAETMATELRAALLLDGVETKALARQLHRLIVLPFRLLRPSDDIQFLALSLPEAITASLAGLQDLVVRSSVVAARYSPESLDLKVLAKEAEVDLVLTGTLLQIGAQLRITAQLVEAPAGTLVWSHSSQATTHQLLDLHDDLVQRVVSAILPSLTPVEHQTLQQDRPSSPTVYELYLRANECGRQWENLPTAIEMYERCVSLDPSYAAGWARLGRARWLWDKYNQGSLEGLQTADEAFQQAFALRPDLALAHNLYTNLQVDQGKTLDAMKRLLDRSRRHSGDPELFAGLAHILRYCGLLQPALAAHHEARRLDPQISTSVMHTYFMLGDYPRALESAASDFGYGLALALVHLGRVDEAVSTLRQREQQKPWRLGRLYLTSLRALLEGNLEESLEVSRELTNATFRDPEGTFYLARQLSYLDEKQMAIETLSRAIEKGFFCYPAMVRDPWLDSLRAQAEFSALLRKAQELHRGALQSFLSLGGDSLLRLKPEGY